MFGVVLDRLQVFLPQIAQANEKLKQEMESCPTGHFDIENVEDAGKVIQMVWLFFPNAGVCVNCGKCVISSTDEF